MTFIAAAADVAKVLKNGPMESYCNPPVTANVQNRLLNARITAVVCLGGGGRPYML